MKKLIYTAIFSVALIGCNSNKKQGKNKDFSVLDSVNIDKKKSTIIQVQEEASKTKTKFSSKLRPNKPILLNQVYTDTIVFTSYDDNYDYFMLLGKKNGKKVSLIYNWEHKETNKYNFKQEDIIKVKWKMKSISIAGDDERLDYLENAIDASKIKSKFNLIDTVFENLDVKKENCKMDWVTLKKIPNNPEETIVVIPEIVEENEDDHYIELNSYIVIANTKTGEIINKYFESSKTNRWVSDAVELREISIDTAPYNITDNTRAFGIRVRFVGSSRANPYENEIISLFIKSKNTLKKVLKNYDMMMYGGEWNTDCVGEFLQENKVLLITKNKTDKYYNLLVKNKITETTNFEDKNGDCDYTEKIAAESTLLKFNGQEYK